MPKDGIHFSFLMSVGILFMGLLSLFASSYQEGDFEAVFSPCGLIGGTLWALGNFLTVPIIENVGLGVGMAIWAGVNMIVAFLVGAIGLEFVGIPLPKEPLARPVCGVAGVLFALGALCIFANIKLPNEEQAPETRPAISLEDGEEHSPDDASAPLSEPLLAEPLEEQVPPATVIEGSGSGNPSLGIAMAVGAGALYGFQMAPLSIWNDKVIHNGSIFDRPIPSDTILALRFFFSQFAGIFLTALLGFVGYCATATQNKPKLVPPEATLPSILCGAVWAVGCAGAMFATSELGNSVGFTLVLNCSFLVNSAWSILIFKEIQGQRNLRLFGGAFFLNLCSSLMISASKG